MTILPHVNRDGKISISFTRIIPPSCTHLCAPFLRPYRHLQRQGSTASFTLSRCETNAWMGLAQSPETQVMRLRVVIHEFPCLSKYARVGGQPALRLMSPDATRVSLR